MPNKSEIEKFDEIWSIVMAMAKAKLWMNSHKGAITDISSAELIIMAKGELDELCVALEDGTYMEIIEEVADVLNFTTAAAYGAVDKYRNRKNNG
jgi:hypothetical protein